ncbi:MAG: hypothetical protein RIS69_1616 [Actinomycetota bacterium]
MPFDSRGPVAKKVPHVLTRPTGDVNDPYYWISNRDDPDTIAYLEAENQHCEDWFAPHAEVVETLFSEIKSRIQETEKAFRPSKMVGGTPHAPKKVRNIPFIAVAPHAKPQLRR